MSSPIFTMMCGVPGSGKSSKAQQIKANFPNTIIVSPDDIRGELYGDVNDQEHNTEVFDVVKQRVRDGLKNNHDVILDATNVNSKRRKAFLWSLEDISCHKRAVIMATPIEICLRRNWCRQRKIPDEVIFRMYRSWQTPASWEGWDDIEIVTYKDNQFKSDLMDYYLAAFTYFNYDQNNPWHSQTLGKHILSVGDYVLNHGGSYDVITAALYHDIGKPFCRTTDENGISHYYGHENVGAYDMLVRGNNLNVSLLVNYHMYPLHWENNDYPERVHDKYRKLWGDDFYNDIMLLHEADVHAGHVGT